MERFQYFDNMVMINNSYFAKYNDFILDCISLNITSPLTENDFIIYKPLVDGKGGVQKIVNNNHLKADNANNIVMDNIINRVYEFINTQKQREVLTRELKRNSIEVAKPIKQKLREAYVSSWPYDEQIEALRDALNGNSTKLNKMNQDFAAVKAQIIANNGGN